ncbi:MAG: hypothetical protein ACD_73C00008G0002 [uncultured bacterium]|nr:MAG: hypothetical protein ACD_73C00008G0002 [uncultured bacterium]
MNRNFLIIMTLLLMFPVFSSYGAAGNSNISRQTSQVSPSIWSNVDWNKIRNWFRPEVITPITPDPVADAERTRMPEGHWLMVTPYSECRDDGVCPPKNDEAQK